MREYNESARAQQYIQKHTHATRNSYVRFEHINNFTYIESHMNVRTHTHTCAYALTYVMRYKYCIYGVRVESKQREKRLWKNHLNE